MVLCKYKWDNILKILAVHEIIAFLNSHDKRIVIHLKGFIELSSSPSHVLLISQLISVFILIFIFSLLIIFQFGCILIICFSAVHYHFIICSFLTIMMFSFTFVILNMRFFLVPLLYKKRHFWYLEVFDNFFCLFMLLVSIWIIPSIHIQILV